MAAEPAKTQHFYPEVNPNPDFPALEQHILAFWERENLFKRSVETRSDAKEFIFYDGPPFANGLPHYGHLLTGYVKDLVARYQTMKGNRVERRFGWDCHGLPAEMGSEKELGISGRQAIMNFGIENFNAHCRTSVMKYTNEWKQYVTRQARWVDFDNGYKTMDTTFMESVLWAFKQLYDKGLVYEAYRVMPYSWAAETPLSNFETRLDNSTREREDKAATVAFELNTKPHGAPDAAKYYILAWTTTPWTLPSNLALAVSTKIDYAFIEANGNCYIVAKPMAAAIAKELKLATPEGWEPATVSGDHLLGLSYHPLFPYFANHPHSFRILDGSDFVTEGDGTGVVHMAPGFGEDDQRVCEANGITIVCPVDGAGKYTDEIFDLPDLALKGLNVIAQTEGQRADEPYKPEQAKKYGLVNLRIITWLKEHGQLIKQEEIKHNYPHCWRTDQPLIYRAVPSWYVEVTKFRERMVELNQQINWIPGHVKDGLFGKWLENARDWSISRNRFWGTPIPVWKSKSGKIKVFGSIAELQEASGQTIVDLHRPFIDDLTISIDGEDYTRVEDVFDCWFESGSMPYGQVHYPFENKDWFENHFPADFIVEYQAQTRGWFYTLMVLSTALFDRPPFLNVICHGVVLDDKGQKLSKRLNNYADPTELFEKFGSDALRWFMMASPVMRGNDLQIDKGGKFIRDVVRLSIKPIWNAYNFFCLYANADGIKAKIATDSSDIMDQYILAKCKQAVVAIEQSFDAYDTPTATEAVSAFFEALNNWYIRRNKERFWSTGHTPDKQAAYDTLYTVLTVMCRAAAPLLPLTLEEIYKTLTGEESVHLASYPDVSSFPDDAETTRQMDYVRDICNAALGVRNTTKIRVRQPLATLTLSSNRGLKLADNLAAIIQDEVNVKQVAISNSFDDVATLKLSINSAILGKRLPEKMKQILPASKKGEWKQANGTVEIAGEALLPGEYILQLEPKPDFKDRSQPLSTNDALVILDTAITPELEAEGLARDLVRMVQQARKDAKLDVSDRIRLFIDGPANVRAAIATHQTYLMEQTLTAEWLTAKPADAVYSVENELEDQKVTIALSR